MQHCSLYNVLRNRFQSVIIRDSVIAVMLRMAGQKSSLKHYDVIFIPIYEQ